MEQILINKKDGSKLYLYQWNNNSGVTKAEQVCELLGQDVINISVVSAQYIPFTIGDWIDVFGFVYKMNSTPHETKINDRSFQYELRFEGPQYDLIKVQYLDVDSLGFSTGTSFFLMGDLEDFAKLIIRNAERVYGVGSWTLGDCPTGTLVQNTTFDNETCLQVLQKVCTDYDYYYQIERLPNDKYVLHIKDITDVLPDNFRYGRAKGLYQLDRQAVTDKNIVTRLFAFGSTRNISPDYRGGAPRLKLPISAIPSEGDPAIKNTLAIQSYGVIEGSVIFEEVYPHRIGTVTALHTDINKFYDSGMTFNLLAKDANGNDMYLLNGIDAKISFNTGDLAGYQFSIAANGYDVTQQLFTILSYTDERGMVFPSTDNLAFRIKVGDQYVITDIKLPQAYIDDAEAELLAKAQQYLADNSKPWVQYDLQIDENYIEAKVNSPSIGNYFKLGYYLKIIDADFNVNGNLQITGFTRELIRHYRYKLTVGETIIEARKSRIRNGKVTNYIYGQTNNGFGLTAKNSAAMKVANTVNANPSNEFMAIAKQTDYQTQIDELKEAVMSQLTYTEYFTVNEDTTFFYDALLYNTKVLAIERNGSLEKVKQDDISFALTFDKTVFKDEILGITFRKLISL